MEHKFLPLTTGDPDYNKLPESAEGNEFKCLLKCFVDDFIGLTILRAHSHLDHVTGGTMHGIHDFFPEKTREDKDDTIAKVKVQRGDTRWMLHKDVLGFNFDGDKKTMILEKPRLEAL